MIFQPGFPNRVQKINLRIIVDYRKIFNLAKPPCFIPDGCNEGSIQHALGSNYQQCGP
jgi:hypothetical protein